MAWDVMSGVTKMAWDVMSGVTKTAWDVLSGVANLCGMFCPGCYKRHGMFCPGMFCPAPGFSVYLNKCRHSPVPCADPEGDRGSGPHPQLKNHKNID